MATEKDKKDKAQKEEKGEGGADSERTSTHVSKSSLDRLRRLVAYQNATAKTAEGQTSHFEALDAAIKSWCEATEKRLGWKPPA